MNDQLKVKIMTPRQVLFNGPAYAVSSKNSQGPFDILSQHANFITIIEKQPIVVLTPERKKVEFNFSQAIITNNQNQVLIFAEPTTL